MQLDPGATVLLLLDHRLLLGRQLLLVMVVVAMVLLLLLLLEPLQIRAVVNNWMVDCSAALVTENSAPTRSFRPSRNLLRKLVDGPDVADDVDACCSVEDC